MGPTRDIPPLIRDRMTPAGLVSRSDLLDVGIPRSTVCRWLHDGMLVPVATGIYADPAVVDGADPWERFRLRSRAFVLVSPPNTYAADWSAVALHRLPTVGEPPAMPSVIRPRSTRSGSNRTVNGRTRFASVPSRWLGDADDVPALVPAFAAVDVARRSDRLASLVVADEVAAREGGRESLTAALADIEGWPGDKKAAWAVRHCDPDVDSPLESAGRLAFITSGLPPSRSNVWVGEYVPEYRLDHFWDDHRLGVEGDGVTKYLTNPAETIKNEKRREWRLQQLGIRVVRYSWAVALGSPGDLAQQVLALMNLPAAPGCGLRTWSNDEGRALLGLGRGVRDRPRNLYLR